VTQVTATCSRIYPCIPDTWYLKRITASDPEAGSPSRAAYRDTQTRQPTVTGDAVGLVMASYDDNRQPNVYWSDDTEHRDPSCRAYEDLLVFISFTETDARFLGEANQRKTEEECGKHEKQRSAIGVL